MSTVRQVRPVGLRCVDGAGRHGSGGGLRWSTGGELYSGGKRVENVVGGGRVEGRRGRGGMAEGDGDGRDCGVKGW